MNWQAHDHAATDETWEYGWYSDSHFSGEVRELGPYDILNTVPVDMSRVRMGLVLRAIQYDLPDPELGMDSEEVWKSTDTSVYHGGTLDEELAALVSLALGVRCRTGGPTRRFKGSDAKGSPFEFEHSPPYLPVASRRGRVLPRIGDQGVSLDPIQPLLEIYAAISSEDAVALARAGRSYQEAIWTAESDPSLAWLRLVSGLETAALQWKGDIGTPEELVADWNRRVFDALKTCDAKTMEPVIRELAVIAGSTKRFKDFCEAFLPEPPTSRPPEAYQLDWDSMRTHLNTIYKARSKALHESTPIPVPMCIAPYGDPEWPAPSEIPWEAMSSTGGRWVREDAPMHLATFEYIARGILLNWWRQLRK